MSMIARAAVALVLLCSVAQAEVYVLGSSYSTDTIPSALDGSPQWHTDCAKPLQFIYLNPQFPCGSGSTPWPVALNAQWFSYVSFQPVDGAGITQQSDIDAIGFWIASLQPYAVAVIHPSWPIQSVFESVHHDSNPDNTFTNRSKSYYDDLIAKLEVAYPGQAFISDRANEMLDGIYHDIENEIGPLVDFEQMFRDSGGHASDYGRYLLHNALRQAFGQPTGVDNTGASIPPTVKAYLDAKVLAFAPLTTPVPGVPPVIPATTIVEHVGAHDPKGMEGWTAQESTVTPPPDDGQFGPIVEPDGTNAWIADDDSTTLQSGGTYFRTLTANERQRAVGFGWKLSTRVRVVDTPDALGPLDGSNVVEFLDGSTEWQLRFGSEADGDPIVDIYSDAAGDFVAYTLQDTHSGYHLYELVFDPSTHTADLFVDGVERISDVTGRPHISIGWVYWGNLSTVDTGHGNYELVRFELFGMDVPAVPPWAIALVAVLYVVGGHVLSRRLSPSSSR